MDYKEKLNTAIEFMVDGELVKFNSAIASLMQSKAAEAIDSAREVVADEMYNFKDEPEDTPEEESE